MKKIYLLLICLVLFVSCKSKKPLEKPVSETSVQTVSQSINFLASDELQGRNTGTKGIDKAATYIEEIFTKVGVKPYFQSYRDTFEAKGGEGYNVVGFLEGHDSQMKNEFVILGAHYDHIGFGKAIAGDSIANGANDNASGTVLVLELAKQLADRKDNRRSILFVLFSAEELGLLGSNHLAKKLKQEKINLYTMINFEMLGVPLKDRDYEVFLTGYDKSNMAEVMNTYAKTNLVGFSEISKKYSLFMRSDNYAFFNEFNVPAHSISSCDLTNFDFYHHVDDEPDKLDMNFMADVTNKLVMVIEGICNSPTKEIILNEE